MIKYEFFEVKKRVQNLPWKQDEFIKGWKLADNYVLGGYTLGEARKNELIKSGHIKKVSKSYIANILINRNVR